MNDEALKFLGLLYLGKNLSIGDNARFDIKKHKSKLVLIANDLNENVQKEIINLCLINKINILRFKTKLELGNALGKSSVAIISLNDEKSAKVFLSKI